MYFIIFLLLIMFVLSTVYFYIMRIGVTINNQLSTMIISLDLSEI